MNEYEEDRVFSDDVREKKRLARQARYHKCGSKGRKCNLSSDRLTKKQWLERCGRTVTYNLNRPILWSDFCELPSYIQKEYLIGLIDKYKTTASDLARMFGVTSRTVTKRCEMDDINIHFSPGKRMTKGSRKAFEEFTKALEFQKEPDLDDSDASPTMADTTPHTVLDNSVKATDMSMTEFTLSFSGNFNREMVYNSLVSMLPNGSSVELYIRCVISREQ